LTVTRSRPRILKDLFHATSSAAAAALLLLSGCSSGEASLRPDVDSLRAEIRTLQRENGDLVRRVEAMGTQLDVLAARSAQGAQSATGESQAAPARVSKVAPPATATPPVTAAAASPLVPAHLKVVRLEQPKAPVARAQKSPAIPTSTPIQEPSTTALAALGSGGKPLAAESQAVLDAARAQAGLPRARALEKFTDNKYGHLRAADALVDAARTRDVAGDPDGSCEDYSRAVAEYPAARAQPDALEGLAACEQRRGRPDEAKRLLARLAKDFPDSPAGKRASEHAPTVQGAAP
jgi:tetratricopeptide (TPR) repeat protein